jgi:hypothetical protein
MPWYTRAIWKVTYSEVLTKQAMKKIILYKNAYILKLLLDVVATGTEPLVVSANKFLYSCAKKVCRLWAQPRFDTFHQLLIFVEALWSQSVLHVCKQVTVARSEIRAVRRVVKQVTVEMLEQCSSASTCMLKRTVMEDHYTECQHSTPFFWMVLRSFFGV